jgi:hypothetical protein
VSTNVTATCPPQAQPSPCVHFLYPKKVPIKRARVVAPFAELSPTPTPTIASDASDYEERTTKSRSNKAKEKGPAPGDEDDDGAMDDRLYCVCRQLYDPERMMIACDRCDNWFHTDVGQLIYGLFLSVRPET